jgi:capsular polysaccharide biosynthesis protein
LENMTIKEQMKTFAEASHIVAAHGAGLTNLLWCQPGTKVIEIQDKNMIHKKVYPLLSHNLNLEHKLYLADVVPIPREKGAKLEGVKRFSDMINFKINIPEIMEHLE